jgi:hypothetical protein
MRMAELFYKNKYFSISNPKDCLGTLSSEFGKECIETQLEDIRLWLHEWTEPTSNFNRDFDNEFCKGLIENAFIGDKNHRWIHSLLLPIVAHEMGYSVKEVTRDRAFPVYIFNLKIKKNAGKSLDSIRRSGTYPLHWKKYESLQLKARSNLS